MSIELHKALVRRLMEDDTSCGGEAVAEAIIHADFVDHTNATGMPHDLEGHKAIVRLFRSVCPDLEWRIDDLIAEGDKVVARTTMRGTQPCASPTARSPSIGAATTASACSASCERSQSLASSRRRSQLADRGRVALPLMPDLGVFRASDQVDAKGFALIERSSDQGDVMGMPTTGKPKEVPHGEVRMAVRPHRWR